MNPQPTTEPRASAESIASGVAHLLRSRFPRAEVRCVGYDVRRRIMVVWEHGPSSNRRIATHWADLTTAGTDDTQILIDHVTTMADRAIREEG